MNSLYVARRKAPNTSYIALLKALLRTMWGVASLSNYQGFEDRHIGPSAQQESANAGRAWVYRCQEVHL
jgi:hypothetical protein